MNTVFLHALLGEASALEASDPLRRLRSLGALEPLPVGLDLHCCATWPKALSELKAMGVALRRWPLGGSSEAVGLRSPSPVAVLVVAHEEPISTAAVGLVRPWRAGPF